MPRGESKKARLKQYLERTRPAAIGEREWSDVGRELAPVSDGYLRGLLRECGLPLEPLIEGVRQDGLAELERTLLALEKEYEAGDTQQRRRCRELVITAKDHARFAARRLTAEDGKRAEKEEMLLWMLTWLENPPAFPVWRALRRGRLER